MAQIAVTALSSILPEDLTTDNSVVTFTADGDTNQVNLFEAVNAAVNTSCNLTLDKAYDSCGAGLGRTITADSGAVKISGEDGLLVTGTFGSGADSEWVGAGTGMFFNPKKAAFRAGVCDSTQWDNVNIGDGSVCLGGGGSIASGFGAVTIGSDNSALGDASTAIGLLTVASGAGSFSGGIESEASGTNSVALGYNINAKSLSETAIGLFNTDYTPTSTTVWNATDRLFVIGNGQTSGTRADALIIQKNGNLTMPTTTGAFSPPILTAMEISSLTPTAGMMVYNSDTNKHQGYDGTSWNNFY